MFIAAILVCVLSFASLFSCRSVDSKTLFRSGDSGAFSLVEFNIKDIIYGKCSYNKNDGTRVSVLFEQHGDEIKARSEIDSILNPVDETKLCREEASKPPSGPIFRDGGMEEEDDDADLQTRFDEIQMEIAKTQDYVSMLRPRFINFIPANFTTTNTAFTGIKGFFSKPAFPTLSGINISTVNVPVPVINIPVAIKNIPVPIIVPALTTFNIQKPIFGK